MGGSRRRLFGMLSNDVNGLGVSCDICGPIPMPPFMPPSVVGYDGTDPKNASISSSMLHIDSL